MNDYTLKTAGLGISLFDRIELSFQRQRLDISSGLTSNVFALLTDGAITNANSATIEQDIVGAKVKIFGDGVFTQNDWLPQLAIGAQYKKIETLIALCLFPMVLYHFLKSVFPFY